jgi:hypothetical protein
MSYATSVIKHHMEWGKFTNGTWCPLDTVDLSHSAFSSGGVYIIWHGSSDAKVVYVGQATQFRDRLSAHRLDPRIQKYKAKGVYVTWATAPKASRDGIEVGLANLFNPLVGDRHPNVPAIRVNGPWD